MEVTIWFHVEDDDEGERRSVTAHVSNVSLWERHMLLDVETLGLVTMLLGWCGFLGYLWAQRDPDTAWGRWVNDALDRRWMGGGGGGLGDLMKKKKKKNIGSGSGSGSGSGGGALSGADEAEEWIKVSNARGQLLGSSGLPGAGEEKQAEKQKKKKKSK